MLANNVYAKTHNWKMTTTWPAGIILIEADRHFYKLVNELSNGEIKIKFFDGGTLISSAQLFDSVSDGVVQAGGNWPSYWAGKDTAFDLLGSCALGMTHIDYMIWYYRGGGYELYQEVYGKFGMVFFPVMVTPMESGIRGHKPIYTLEDFKGLKVRVSGRMQGELLKKIGASQINLAGGEVYQALEKGVIDAGEFGAPSIDWMMGFQEVTEYWAVPGWHQPTSVNGVMINKKAWDALSPRLQTMVRTAAEATMSWMFSFLEYESYSATKKFIDKGIKITRLDDASLAKLQDMAQELILKYSAENPLYAKIAYSQMKFLQDSAKWREVSSPFTYGRNVPVPLIDDVKKYLK
ncbi:TRAP transporter substrate-binding protein DctP [bacterium]|nr:TRAP transporter substrate-binding protein DctP [bacterium]